MAEETKEAERLDFGVWDFYMGLQSLGAQNWEFSAALWLTALGSGFQSLGF